MGYSKYSETWLFDKEKAIAQIIGKVEGISDIDGSAI